MSDLDVKLRIDLIRDTAGPSRQVVRDLSKIKKALAGLEGGKPIQIKTDGSAARAVDKVNGIGKAADRAKADLANLKSSIAGVDNETLDRVKGELKDIDNAAGNAKAKMTSLKGAIDRVDDAQLDKLKGEIKGAIGAADNTKLDKVKNEVRELGNEADKTKADVRGVKTALDTVDDTKLDKVKREFDDVGKAAEKAGKKGRKASGRTRDRNTTGDAGREAYERLGGTQIAPIGLGKGAAIGAITAGGILALGAGIRKVVGEAMSLKDAMAEVQKALNVPEAKMEETLSRIESNIIDLSQSSGIAKEDVATLFAVAARNGIAVEDLGTTAMRGAKAGIAFDMGAEKSAGALATLKNQLGATEAEMDDLVNIINHLGDNTAARENDLLNFSSRVAGNAKIIGLSKDQMAAYGAGFISLGTAPEVAARALNSFITTIAASGSISDRGVAGLKKIGLEAKNLTKSLEADPSGTMLDILDRVSTKSGAEQIAILADVFGRGFADDLAKLVSARDVIKGTLDLVKNPEDRKGSVDKSFDIFSESPGRKIAKLGTAFDALATKIGDKLLPAVVSTAEAMTDFVNAIVDDMQRAEQAEVVGAKTAKGVKLNDQDRKALETDPEAAINRWTEKAIGGKKRAKSKSDNQGVLNRLKGQTGTVDLGGAHNKKNIVNADKLRDQLQSEINEIDDIEAAITPSLKGVSKAELQEQLASLTKQLETVKGRVSFDPGMQAQKLVAIEEIEREISRVKKALGESLGPSASNAMGPYNDRLQAEALSATGIATRAAADMARALSFTATPTISPRFTSAQPAAKVAGAKTAAAQPVSNTFHINGASNPQQVASAVVRRQNQSIRGSKSAALHDTGAIA